MMSYQEFYDATDIPKCGRGKRLKALGDRVQACDGGLTTAKLIAVFTAAHAWGWDKGSKHKDHPTANFNLRLQAVQSLVGQVKQELNALGVDANTVERASLSYEKHKRAGTRKGLQSLGKGYHLERKQFASMKKSGDGGKDARFAPRGGSFVSEIVSSAKSLRANYKQQVADGLNVQDTLGQLVTDEKLLKLLLSKDIHSLSENEFNTVFEQAQDLAGQNSPNVNFLRKTDRVERFLTWCDGGRFYKKDGLPHTSAGNEIYAMDKYGNLVTMQPDMRFSTNSGKFTTQGDIQHNHSSLNAGADVISAGEICFQAGYITHIDNASGHYKPTAKQVQQCVYSLRMADDADLAQLKIRVWHKGNWVDYNDAGIFLAARF